MKAWVLENINDFRLKEVEAPTPNEGEVVVRVKACGICGSDIPRVYETGAHKLPIIIGHEFSGEVASGPMAGKRVGVFPLIPCQSCAPCQKKLYELCRHYDYLGSRRDGGFAEYVSVPAWNLIDLPDTVSFEQAAMLEPMSVAVHAMRRSETIRKAASQQTDRPRVAVMGLGAIGLLLVMFLLDAGISDLYVIGNKDFQKERIKQLGLDESRFCDSRTQDVRRFLSDATKQNGVDVFFECIGKNESVSVAADATTFGGNAVLVGNPHTDMTLEKNTYWKILRNQLTLTGTWNSSYPDDWTYVLSRLEKKTIHPEDLITHRFSMDELEQGFSVMKNKTEEYIKIMMVP